jgi:hypothetical protein
VSDCYATQGGSSGFGLTDLMQEYMPVVDSDNLLGSVQKGEGVTQVRSRCEGFDMRRGGC